ncbi:MAG: cell division protein FtsZ [Alphaproteobacteria bacterium]|nr:cell division protein FtsZ [Alphaproteobacteria bacterium]
MALNLTVPEKTMLQLKPRISVIGVGGGGGNAVNNMITQKLEGVDFIVANTDAQALENSKTQRRIQLGLETTKGLGAGARPEIGKLAAEEAIEEIERELEGANMVFITAGMGGGTGSGAAPVVAKIAKEKGILTVGVVTKPFQFEGKKRSETAESALENFTKEVDSIIVIPNQNLFRIADKNTKLSDAFIMADNVLYDGVRSITDLMIMPGLINLDFADVKAIMEDKGKAIMGTGEAEGEDRAVKAAEQALSNPLLDDCSMKGAKGVLINITASQDITLMEVDDAVNRIKEEVDEDANIIFGSSFDASLDGKIRVSIVATGIDEKAKTRIEPVKRIEPVITPASAQVVVKEIIEEPRTNSIEDVLGQISEDIAENAEEKIEYAVENEPVVLEEQVERSVSFRKNMFEDFDTVEKSDVISDMPNSSSLFKAFINKQDEEDVKDISTNKQIAEAIESVDSPFVPKTALVMPNKEPELFPNHNPAPVITKREEEIEEFIPSNNETTFRSFIDRFTNRSIAKRNKQKQDARVQEPITPSFSEDVDDKVNLEIPAFLRRR